MKNSDKGIITITVNKDITQKEINEIRNIFKKDEQYKDYKLNIIVSGNKNFKQTLKEFIIAGQSNF